MHYIKTFEVNYDGTQRSQSPVITWNATTINNNSLVALSVVLPSVDGPNITAGGVQFQLLTATNVDPPVFQLTCTSTSSPATDVQWTVNKTAVNKSSTVSSQKVTDRPTSTYNNTVIVTGRTAGMYTCNVTTTCTPVCGGFSRNPRSAISSLNVSGKECLSTIFVPIDMHLNTAAPAPPTNVTAVQSGPTCANVSWTSGGSEASYDIYYVANGVSSTKGGSTNSNFFVLTNLQVGILYNITLIAVGLHIPSQSAKTTLILKPGPVSGLKAINNTFTMITLTWQPLNGMISVYLVNYTNEIVNTVNKTIPPVTITGLIPRTAYTFSVTGYIVTGPGIPQLLHTNTADIPNVTGVMVSTINATSIRVSWLAVQLPPDGNLTWYTVYYCFLPKTSKRESGGYTYQTFPPTATFGVINNLNPNDKYQFSVVAQVTIRGQLYSGVIPLSGSTIKPGISPISAAGAVGGAVGGVILLIAAIVIVAIVTLVRCNRRNVKRFVTPQSYEMVNKTVHPTMEVDFSEEAQYATISGEPARQAPSIKNFPIDYDVVEGEEVVFNVRISGYPRPSVTWYRNGINVITDESFTFGEDGHLIIHMAQVGHAGVYELEVANELGVERDRMCLGVYESEKELPGDYQIAMPAVPLTSFGQYMLSNHVNNNTGFKNQFRSLESSTNHLSMVALFHENKALNRFANIVPCEFGICYNLDGDEESYTPPDDENLIKLSLMESQKDCQRSYINASYIAGYLEPKKFIATQGPLPSTIVDFWRLVWQEGVTTIAMVTNIKEDGKVKCNQYWAESGHQEFGPFSIAITDQDDFADYIIRSFEVALSGSTPRKVTQFHFTGWPDHGVPGYATSLLAFHRKVKSKHNGTKGPLLVHCSAGVGRTGTLIAMDIVMEQIEKERLVDIAGTIRNMRQQRMKMVQTLDQYIFLHDAIFEYVMCGNTQIKPSDINTLFNVLETKDSASKKSGLDLQFEVLGQVSPDPKSVYRDVALNEAGKNRSMDYLPPDKYRVILKQKYPDYINATFVNGYKKQKAFIITQGPLKSTRRDFWKMVHDKGCGAIVMLSQLEEEGKEVCHQYWPDNGVERYGEFTVERKELEDHDGYITRTFYLTSDKNTHVQQVTQFHITNWTPDGVCTNFAAITDVIEEVDKVQRRTGNPPIVVHCSGRSGMFCAITIVTQQCKTEGVVDVFQAVKSIRSQKPGAVLTENQYQLILKIVIVFLDQYDQYSNFR
eukprot:Em0390g1a